MLPSSEGGTDLEHWLRFGVRSMRTLAHWGQRQPELRIRSRVMAAAGATPDEGMVRPDQPAGGGTKHFLRSTYVRQFITAAALCRCGHAERFIVLASAFKESNRAISTYFAHSDTSRKGPPTSTWASRSSPRLNVSGVWPGAGSWSASIITASVPGSQGDGRCCQCRR